MEAQTLILYGSAASRGFRDAPRKATWFRSAGATAADRPEVPVRYMTPEMIPQNLSHYKILEKLGDGGMGVVYKAQDTHLNRLVAIKVLPADKLANEERKARFVREARAASSLNHPSIITIHDIANDQGIDFIVMEYVAGKTLGQLIPRKGMRLEELLKLAIPMADALAAAHAEGIVHRDLKPGNVMVTDSGRVKVLDFGLAKLSDKAEASEFDVTQIFSAGDGPKTDEGTILGTVSYMSPEQAEGKPVDARSDIFSFGSLFYEMATGQCAFQGDSGVSILAAILHKDPKPVSGIGDGIPRELERLISRCLRKDPARRFQHMDDLKVALEELKEDSDSGKLESGASSNLPPPRRKGRSVLWALAGGAVLLIAALAAWLRTGSGPSAPSQQLNIARLTSTGKATAAAISPDGIRWWCCVYPSRISTRSPAVTRDCEPRSSASPRVATSRIARCSRTLRS